MIWWGWEKIAGLLLGYGHKFIPTVTAGGVKATMDMAKLPAELEKLRLEIELLKQKVAESKPKNLVTLATNADIDPAYRERERMARRALPIILIFVFLGSMSLSRAGTDAALVLLPAMAATCVFMWLRHLLRARRKQVNEQFLVFFQTPHGLIRAAL